MKRSSGPRMGELEASRFGQYIRRATACAGVRSHDLGLSIVQMGIEKYFI